MPIRLNVVLSQPEPGQRREQDMADQVVGQLLGRSSMDLGLIGPLESVAQAPTDQLMLDGLAGDFAIVAWSDAPSTYDRLQRLGVAGRRAAHRDDPSVPAGSGRRIYCFDGSAYASAAELVDALAALLKDRQVVTVGLGVAGVAAGRDRPAAAPANPSPATPQTAAARSSSGPPPTQPAPERAPAPASKAATLPAKEAATEAARPKPLGPADDPRDALDALVDDLNAMDL